MRYLVVLLLLSTISNSRAQHCGFDSEAIFMLRPVDMKEEVIDGLRIMMVDSATGLPLKTSDDDSVIFYRNAPPPDGDRHGSFWITKDVGHRFRQQYGFNFGEDNYLVTFYFGTTSDRAVQLKIEDTLSSRKGGAYKMMYIDLPRKMCFPLCTSNDWSVIKPVRIALAR
jgi:hypothetical protein